MLKWAMATMASPVQNWSKLIRLVAPLDPANIAESAEIMTEAAKNSLQRGYKLFWDSYVHDIEGIIYRQAQVCLIFVLEIIHRSEI